jgi:glycosyltransferase involved in cell wall biosynthesis
MDNGLIHERKPISICIIIPVRNVEKMIGKVIHEIISAVSDYKIHLLVLDNSSDDNTKRNVTDIFKFFEKNSNLSLNYILNDNDLGYGGSVKKGFEIAKKTECEWIMIAHGDDQADWKSVASLILDTIRNEKCDLVVTSRFMDASRIENYSFQRKAGNYFFRIITNKLFKTSMSDPGAAIIAIKGDKLDLNWINILKNDYLFHPGLNVIFYTSNLKIKEIPMNWRDASQPGELKLIKYGLSLLKFIGLIFFQRKFLKSNWIDAIKYASN